MAIKVDYPKRKKTIIRFEDADRDVERGGKWQPAHFFSKKEKNWSGGRRKGDSVTRLLRKGSGAWQENRNA